MTTSQTYPLTTRVRNQAHRGVMSFRRWYFRRIWGADIGQGVRIALTAKMDKTNPHGLVIGDYSAVAFGAAILTHDYINRVHRTTTIGSNTFIGARSIVMPGVTIGDGCIVSALSLVARDVPAGCVVMGNPARVVEKNIVVGPYGARAPAEAAA